MKILYINACVRKNSRTKRLAEHLLSKMNGEITEICLEQEDLHPLTGTLLARREHLLSEGACKDPVFRYARQFASADIIVIAAPYWDLGFPALLKLYLETVSVSGITFHYVQDKPEGLCNARKLFYITTAGGPISVDFGYEYVKALAENFYGISQTRCYKAENLDIIGMDVESLLRQAEAKIDRETDDILCI